MPTKFEPSNKNAAVKKDSVLQVVVQRIEFFILQVMHCFHLQSFFAYNRFLFLCFSCVFIFSIFCSVSVLVNEYINFLFFCTLSFFINVNHTYQ